jgi:methylphosphotriester-DNA--protein-cysteine methyltransferase
MRVVYIKKFQDALGRNTSNVKQKAEIIFNCIENNLLDVRLNEKFIMTKTGLSKATIYRTIKIIFGITFKDLLRKIRNEIVLNALSYEPNKLDLCKQTGFIYETTLERNLIKEFGKTVKQIREGLNKSRN